MCAVWSNSRIVLAFAAVAALGTSALNIANLIWLSATQKDVFSASVSTTDTEVVPIYGLSHVSLAAAFISLASNVCATFLVGLKAW